MKKQNTLTDEFAEPAATLVKGAQDLLAATAHVAEEKVVEARERLSGAVERGREAWRTVQSAAFKRAKVADQSIRQHPYHAIGIALGIGIVLGLLARRRD